MESSFDQHPVQVFAGTPLLVLFLKQAAGLYFGSEGQLRRLFR